MSTKNVGSSIDDFLKEEGIFEEAQTQAIQEVVAWQLAEAMKYAIVYEKTATGYSAYVPDVPGCVAAGTTLQETEELMRGALQMHLNQLARAKLRGAFERGLYNDGEHNWSRGDLYDR